ncbi:DNA polymerase zeta catalytic subunit-like [Antedon mediterranea]|uniref:DNA polymerase zeta catalytic subunit-like n=1 Tax=Antedon mediterranea TaxID=105859 RepID=UPI003AF5B2FE
MEDKMLSVRIVTADTYMSEPIADLDITYSDFRGCDVKRVPVVRVFGATPAGQKTCLHIHGLLPYIYVPYDGPRPVEDDQYLLQFAISVDKALQVAMNQSIKNQTLHVFKISLVSGIPFYGYYEEEKLFMKIYFCNPLMVKKAVDLLHGGAIMNKVHQPHEAHIPFLLQFFIDYNLSGMDLVNISAFKFRSPNDTEEKPSNYLLNKQDVSSNSCYGDLSTTYYDLNRIPRNAILDTAKQSTCELEVDCVAVDILNRLQIQENVGRNPGLLAIWEDEKKRREELNQVSQLLPPSSPERGFIPPTASEKQQLARLDDIIQQQHALLHSQHEESDSSQDTLQLLSQSEQSFLNSSQSQDAQNRREVKPCIDEEAVLSVVEASQSFSMSQHIGSTQDKHLVALLADLATETSLEEGSMLSGLSSIEIKEEEGQVQFDVEEEEERIMMTQAWDDDVVAMATQHSIKLCSDDNDIHLSWFDDTLEETDDKIVDKLPQVDGGSDEKEEDTVSTQCIPKTKTLGVRWRNLPLQFDNQMKVTKLNTQMCRAEVDKNNFQQNKDIKGDRKYTENGNDELKVNKGEEVTAEINSLDRLITTDTKQSEEIVEPEILPTDVSTAVLDVSDPTIQLKDSGYLEDSEDVKESSCEDKTLLQVPNIQACEDANSAQKQPDVKNSEFVKNVISSPDVSPENKEEYKVPENKPSNEMLTTINTLELNELRKPAMNNCSREVILEDKGLKHDKQSITTNPMEKDPGKKNQKCLNGDVLTCNNDYLNENIKTDLKNTPELNISDDDFKEGRFFPNKKRRKTNPITKKANSRINRKSRTNPCKNVLMESLMKDCSSEKYQNDDIDDDFELKEKKKPKALMSSSFGGNPFVGCRTLRVVVHKVNAEKQTVLLTKKFLSDIERQLKKIKKIDLRRSIEKENKRKIVNFPPKVHNLIQSPKRRLACKKIPKKKEKPALLFLDNIYPARKFKNGTRNDSISEPRHGQYDLRKDIRNVQQNQLGVFKQVSHETDMNITEQRCPIVPRVGIKFLKQDGHLIVQDINSPSRHYDLTKDKFKKQKPSKLSRKFFDNKTVVKKLPEQMFDTTNTDCDSLYQDVLLSFAYMSPICPPEVSSPPRCWSPTSNIDIKDASVVSVKTMTSSKQRNVGNIRNLGNVKRIKPSNNITQTNCDNVLMSKNYKTNQGSRNVNLTEREEFDEVMHVEKSPVKENVVCSVDSEKNRESKEKKTQKVRRNKRKRTSDGASQKLKRKRRNTGNLHKECNPVNSEETLCKNIDTISLNNSAGISKLPLSKNILCSSDNEDKVNASESASFLDLFRKAIEDQNNHPDDSLLEVVSQESASVDSTCLKMYGAAIGLPDNVDSHKIQEDATINSPIPNTSVSALDKIETGINSDFDNTSDCALTKIPEMLTETVDAVSPLSSNAEMKEHQEDCLQTDALISNSVLPNSPEAIVTASEAVVQKASNDSKKMTETTMLKESLNTVGAKSGEPKCAITKDVDSKNESSSYKLLNSDMVEKPDTSIDDITPEQYNNSFTSDYTALSQKTGNNQERSQNLSDSLYSTGSDSNVETSFNLLDSQGFLVEGEPTYKVICSTASHVISSQESNGFSLNSCNGSSLNNSSSDSICIDSQDVLNTNEIEVESENIIQNRETGTETSAVQDIKSETSNDDSQISHEPSIEVPITNLVEQNQSLEEIEFINHKEEIEVNNIGAEVEILDQQHSEEKIGNSEQNDNLIDGLEFKAGSNESNFILEPTISTDLGQQHSIITEPQNHYSKDETSPSFIQDENNLCSSSFTKLFHGKETESNQCSPIPIFSVPDTPEPPKQSVEVVKSKQQSVKQPSEQEDSIFIKTQNRKRPLEESLEDDSVMCVMCSQNISCSKTNESSEINCKTSESCKTSKRKEYQSNKEPIKEDKQQEFHKKSKTKTSDEGPKDDDTPSTNGLPVGVKVWMPQQLPPSQTEVTESLSKFGLKEFHHQEAFCQSPADLPDKSSNQPSHHNRIKSVIPSEFPKCRSVLSENGIQHWRKCLVNSFTEVHSTSQDLNNSFQLINEIETRPELRALTLSNKTTVITPCKLPPSRSGVTKWMEGKELYKQKKRIKVERSGNICEQDKNKSVHEKIKEKSDEKVKSFSSELYKTPVSDKPMTKLPLFKNQPCHSTPFREASKSFTAGTPAISQRNTSIPHTSTSTPIHITQCTPILNVKETLTDNGKQQDLKLNMQNLETFATPVARAASDLSEIDGPTPRNAFGFKVSQHNLKDAKAVHEVQHITVMSLEVHCRTRLNYRPDPEADAVFAIFYCIQSDTLDDNLRNTTGVITLDPGLLNDWNEVDNGRGKRSFLARTGITQLEEIVVKSEQAIFEELVKIVKRFDPDIFVGYEIQMLSWGYILQRAEFISIDLCSQLSRIPGAKKSKFSAQKDEWGADHMSEISIVGRIVLNLWRLLRHEVALTNYRFENVAFHVLHQRIPEYSFRSLADWFDHKTDLYRWRTIEHYMIRVVGIMKLLNQLDLIGRTSELARVFGIQFYSVLSRGSQYRVESMMLRLAKPMNYIAVTPSVQQRARMNAPVCIPLVMEPESRFYEDPVIVLDFQSLYPSMMMAYNYCYSTCLGKIEGIAENGEFKFGCTSYSIPHRKLRRLFNKNDIHVSPNGVAFVKSHVRRGVLPKMVEEILGARVMVKKAMKDHKQNKVLLRMLDSRQLGLKLIANVTYGYTSASFSGRMPCVEIGDSIVRKARETLERAIYLVENSDKWDAQVVYGDTDSLFIVVKGASKEQAFKIAKEMVDDVTADNPKPVKLKFEKVYHPCVLQSKKRYVGYSYETLDQKEPIFDAKGIETVRRDSCPAVGKILERSIKVLFNTHNISEVKSYVKRQCNKVLEGRISMQDLIFAKEYRGINSYRPGACVPALELAKRMLSNDRRSEPRTGERVPYVIVYGSPGLPLIQLVRSPLEVVKNTSQRLNSIYYVTKQILPPLDRIMSLFGVDVYQWYNELPKVVKFAPPTSNTAESKQGTISQYFNTMNCEICDQLTKTGICASCRKNTQNVATTLCYRMHDIERNYSVLKTICNSCQGFSHEKQVCLSLDCPVMFKLSKATLELNRLEAMQNILSTSTDVQ